MTITELLEQNHIGQSELARRTGIPLRTIQDWATDRRKPPEWLPKLIECWLKNN